MNSQPICIYHKDCSDGTAAAAVFLKKFSEGKTFPLSYGYSEKDAELIFQNVDKDTIVYTVDCCLLTKECLEKGNKVISLDHHIGVYEEMTELAKQQSNYTYVFDNNKSGASLTWTYFFPDTPTPEWITFVEDKDLWTKRFKESDYFGNWTYMQVNQPQKLQFLFDDTDALKVCVEKGRLIDELNVFYVDAFKEKAQPLWIKYKENLIPAYNSTYLQSILGNVLADEKLGVSAIFSIKGNSVRLSIRSVKDSYISALEIAQFFGGGGHRNAAGCEMLFSDFSKIITNKI